MSDELVRVRDLKKIFSVPAGELHAVDGVDFSIARGSTIGIVGESGCGKSTMGRLLAMLLEATSGEILFDGQNIAKKMSKAEAMAYKKRIQMIFQDPFSSLNPRMTTFETIIEPLNIHRAGTLQEREARVYQLMETVGLSERFVNAYPHELDGGRRPRPAGRMGRCRRLLPVLPLDGTGLYPEGGGPDSPAWRAVHGLRLRHHPALQQAGGDGLPGPAGLYPPYGGHAPGGARHLSPLGQG